MAMEARQEIIDGIHGVPERKLGFLRQVVDFLRDDNDDDELTAEEMALIDQSEKNWKDNPESFHDWGDVKKEMGFRTSK